MDPGNSIFLKNGGPEGQNTQNESLKCFFVYKENANIET